MSAPRSPIPTRLRASEKVRLFLEKELLVLSAASGSRLPTIKEISKHLQVSAYTVHAVVSRMTKEGWIVSLPGRGLFANLDRKPPAASPLPEDTVILVSIHEPEFTAPGMTWGKEISAAILRELTSGAESALMHPFFVDRSGDDKELIRKKADQAAALIVFPSPLNQQLIEAFRERGKPIIWITSPEPDSVNNLVAINNYRISYRIGSALAQAGRRRLALLLNHFIDERGGYAHTLAGFEAVRQRHPELEFSCHTVEGDPEKSLPSVLDMLSGREPSLDAIYSPSNSLLTASMQWASKRGLKISDDLSLIAGSGLPWSANSPLLLATVGIPFHRIGSEAARMAMAALHSGNTLQPAILLEAGFQAGETCRPIENQMLASQ